MTGQLPDEVTYHDRRYAITAVEGAGLFDPAAHGLELVPVHTGLWRGHQCRYAVRDDRLALTYVEIGQSDRNAGIRLFGAAPRRAYPGDWNRNLAFDVAEPVDFTGRLLLGDEYVRVGRLHMGFRPAWLFADVQELVFARGRLTQAYDRSAALAEVRERLGAAGLGPAPGQASAEWIDATFSLSFAYAWPPLPESPPDSPLPEPPGAGPPGD